MMEFLLFCAIISLGFWAYYLEKRRRDDIQNINTKWRKLITQGEDVQQILRAGMHGRFHKDPYAFEHFVANVLHEHFGGVIEVTRASGDGGVDIKHTLQNIPEEDQELPKYNHYRPEGLYLGQVKCYALDKKIGYIPIAILHSQMVKQNAKGGFFVTTSSYNESARVYADGLNIKLIDGEEFLQMWMETVLKDEYTKDQLIVEPSFQ